MSAPNATADERHLILQTLRAALSALGSVVGRNTELVLHDLTTPEKSVLAIVNGHVSGRAVGSPVLDVLQQDKGFSALLNGMDTSTGPCVIPDYATRGRNGNALRSATAFYRDGDGTPFAALCINTDNGDLLAAKASIDRLLNAAEPAAETPAEPADMEQLMAEIIAESLQDLSGNQRGIRKQARLDAVRRMQERGMFIVKGGIEQAAAALGVTRYTVYNYLEEIRTSAANEAK